jgi:hypothetical protein
MPFKSKSITYDHRLERAGHPVRSAIHKLQIGGLVVGSVTTSEYPLLYVFLPFVFAAFGEESTAVDQEASIPFASYTVIILCI